jgi:hypothetical protein
MKILIKKLLVFVIYCFGYLSVINTSASVINNTTDTLTLNEIISIQGMKSGQEDVFTFLKLKFQNIDVKSIQEEVLKEIEKI